MNQDVVINLVMNAVTLAIKVAMPILLLKTPGGRWKELAGPGE